MQDKPNENFGAGLPREATEFIRRVLRRMWYRRKARRDVQAELTAHFEDAVRDCATAEEKERRVRELIEEFGDAKLLAALCHRAKKRCRPLWLKVLLRTTQGLGIGLLYCVLCSLPLLLARATIRVNYGEWLNNHWRPEGQGVENANVYYDKAAELWLCHRGNWRRRCDCAGGRPSATAIARCARSGSGWPRTRRIPALRRGASTPQFWPVYDSNECRSNASRPLLAGLVMAETKIPGAWRYELTLAFKQQIIWEAKQGEAAKALDDCLVLRRFGRHLQDKGSVPGQLEGIAIEMTAYGGITAFLQNADVSAAALEHVQRELAASFDPGRQVIGLDCEKVLWYDEIQRTFTDNGKGGGRALAEGLFYASAAGKATCLTPFVFTIPTVAKL